MLLCISLRFILKVLHILPSTAAKLPAKPSSPRPASIEDVTLNVHAVAVAKANTPPALSARSVLAGDLAQLNVRQVSAADALDALAARLPALPHLTMPALNFGDAEPVPGRV